MKKTPKKKAVVNKPVKKAVVKKPVKKKEAKEKPLLPAELIPTENEYEPEKSITGVPKLFMLRCPKCRWGRSSSGVSADLADLIEVKNNCASCGKARKFRCPKCGVACPLKRIKGNS